MMVGFSVKDGLSDEYFLFLVLGKSVVVGLVHLMTC